MIRIPEHGQFTGRPDNMKINVAVRILSGYKLITGGDFVWYEPGEIPFCHLQTYK